MRLGLCGAQRVGKTTLARAFAEAVGIPFVETNTREVFKRLGLDPKVQYPIQHRMLIQQEILLELYSQWKANETAIFDRTPFDVLAYQEADILRDFPNDGDLIRTYMEYRKLCLTATSLFKAIVLIQPGIPIIEDAQAAPGTLPYMEHFNTLCLGYQSIVSMGIDPDLLGIVLPQTYAMPRQVLKLEDRISALTNIYNQCK